MTACSWSQREGWDRLRDVLRKAEEGEEAVPSYDSILAAIRALDSPAPGTADPACLEPRSAAPRLGPARICASRPLPGSA